MQRRRKKLNPRRRSIKASDVKTRESPHPVEKQVEYLVITPRGIRLEGGVTMHEADTKEHERSGHHIKREAQAGNPCEVRVAMDVLKSDGRIVVRNLL